MHFVPADYNKASKSVMLTKSGIFHTIYLLWRSWVDVICDYSLPGMISTFTVFGPRSTRFPLQDLQKLCRPKIFLSVLLPLTQLFIKQSQFIQVNVEMLVNTATGSGLQFKSHRFLEMGIQKSLLHSSPKGKHIYWWYIHWRLKVSAEKWKRIIFNNSLYQEEDFYHLTGSVKNTREQTFPL